MGRLKEVFKIDVRALAFFRVCLALIIIFDLIIRSTSLVAHYTDLGTMPRSLVNEKFGLLNWVSVHMLSGSAGFQVFLFILAGIFALMLLVGYRTKLSTIASWFLLISLQSRNPMVLQGGDIMLRMLVFWAMFLPLGLKYSIDEAKNIRNGIETNRKSILSFGTVGILMQVASVYFFSALLKTGNEWYPNGTALYYALSIDQFATYAGKFLLGFHSLLGPLTYFVYFLELIGPLLLFIPFFFPYLRTIMAFLFFALTLGMGLSLNLGPFPFIGAAGFILFLPSWFWDKVQELFYRKENERLRVYYDGECGTCRFSIALLRVFLMLPKSAFLPAQSRKDILGLMNKNNSWVVDFEGRKYFRFDAFKPVLSASPLFWPLSYIISISWMRKIGNWFYRAFARRRKHVCEIPEIKQERVNRKKILFATGNILAAFFIIFIIAWNVQSLGKNNAVPNGIEFIAHKLRIDQYWNMFSPFPLKDDGWYVIDASLANGKHIDLLRDGKPVDFEKPSHVAYLYKHERWRKYLMNLWSRDNSVYRPYYLQYLCYDWNKNHEANEKLKEINMYFMLEFTLPDYQKPNIEKILLGQQECF